MPVSPPGQRFTHMPARHWWAAWAIVLGACGSPAEWTEPATGMVFALVPAGHFVMGSPASEALREEQETQHEVVIRRPFYLGRFEVTQAQWIAVMGANPSRFQACGERCPIENVSLFEIELFLQRLGERSAAKLRLPTETEWEYACRAGTTSAYAFGPSLSLSQANFDDHLPGAPPGEGPEPASSTVPVGSYPPNAWGLYDLHGNVWEWTADPHCPYPASAEDEPSSRCESALQVIRGGSWHFAADSARCALRYTHDPRDGGPSLGFRLARDVP